jgi:SAM-dependent methyltransferase
VRPGRRIVRRVTDETRHKAQLRHFRDEFDAFKAQSDGRLSVEWDDRWLRLDDDTPTTAFPRQYVYHVAWAAKVIASNPPALHVDIGSSLYFPAMLSAFVPVRFYDFRPAELDVEGVESLPGNLLSLPFPDRSVASLSCMHTVEHVGLGRYGDPIDFDGDLQAMSELQRSLAPDGSLLFVVPVGRPRVVFNAHRIYSYEQIIEPFSALELAEFALIPEHGPNGLIRNADPELVSGEEYGCGCFHFRAPSPGIESSD